MTPTTVSRMLEMALVVAKPVVKAELPVASVSVFSAAVQVPLPHRPPRMSAASGFLEIAEVIGGFSDRGGHTGNLDDRALADDGVFGHGDGLILDVHGLKNDAEAAENIDGLSVNRFGYHDFLSDQR